MIVFTKSSLFEQTTPVSGALGDTAASASSVAFLDDDLDASQTGGSVTWSPPADVTHVTAYALFATNAALEVGSRSLVGSDVAVGTNVLAFAADTALPTATLTRLSVYAKSSLAEQTTPAALELTDVAASVSSVALTDEDLDGTQLGGTITWSAPADASRVAQYRAYLADDASGANKALQEAVAVGTNAAQVAENTAKGSYARAVVYSQSALTEQTTPVASSALVDEASTVGSVAFVDKDSGARSSGGS